MKYYLREHGRIDGPWPLDYISELLDAGKWTIDAEAIEGRNRSVPDLEVATDWVALSAVLEGGLALQEAQQQPRAGMESSPIVGRYRDGYRVGAALVGLGGVIKVGGAILGVLIALLGLGSGGGGLVFVGAIFMGGVMGVFLWAIGVIVGAQGEVLRAVLDTAVSTSPLLSDQERSLAMGVPTRVPQG